MARNTDPIKNSIKDPLPPDMESDLRDSFEFFAKEETLINKSDFESIIHNFGFSRIVQQREKELELIKADSDYYKRTGYGYEFLELVVNLRYHKNKGAEMEAVAAFTVFDRYENRFIKPSNLKQIFADYLDHAVTDQDISDIMAACDKNNTGSITFPEFKKFYFS